MPWAVILKNLNLPGERITLGGGYPTRDHAEAVRKNWAVDRRPGLDTLDNLALTVEQQP